MSRKCIRKGTFLQVIEGCFCEFDIGTFFFFTQNAFYYIRRNNTPLAILKIHNGAKFRYEKKTFNATLFVEISWYVERVSKKFIST